MPHQASCIPRAGPWLRSGPLVRRRPAPAQEPSLTIEKLIADGWEVAGYVAAWENRSPILFKHKEHNYLVQCSVLNVMRDPRVVTTCYEIK
jgi:hypothetical protein